MTLTKNELREIDIRYEIEELKKERKLTDFTDEEEIIDKKIDDLEIELLSMVDDETEQEYQERKAEEINNQRELENSQR